MVILGNTKYEQRHNTLTAIAVFGVAVAYLLIIALNNVLYHNEISWDFMLYCTMCGAPFIIVEGIFCLKMVQWCNRREYDARYERWVFMSQVLINAAIIGVFTIVAFLIFDPIEHETFGGLTHELYFRLSMIADLMVGTVILLVAQFVDKLDYSKYQEKQLEEKQLLITQMRYQQLKAQVNPHFLFNSLNILVSLINIDPNKAAKYTRELASIYRYLLSRDEQMLSTLKEEFNFCAKYAGILSMRFNEGLTVNLPTLTDTMVSSMRVVPTAVQVLIENAIKHNLASTESPLTVDVFIDNNNVVVTNNINPRPREADSTGLGLKGLIEKYALITNRKIAIEETSEKFTVRVPLLSHTECQGLMLMQKPEEAQ